MTILSDKPDKCRLKQLIQDALAKSKGRAPRVKAAGPKPPSDLEQKFHQQVMLAGLDDGMETEYRAIPGRQFRWDAAWPAQRLLVELNGGVWGTSKSNKTGHNSGVALNRDAEKANLAVLAGWRTLAFTINHVRSGQALLWLREALGDSHVG